MEDENTLIEESSRMLQENQFYAGKYLCTQQLFLVLVVLF